MRLRVPRARDIVVDPGQRPGHAQRGTLEVNLGPLEREQFALAEAGGHREHPEGLKRGAPRSMEESPRLIRI